MGMRTDVTLQWNSVEDGVEKQGGSDPREKGRFPGVCPRRPETDPRAAVRTVSTGPRRCRRQA